MLNHANIKLEFLKIICMLWAIPNIHCIALSNNTVTDPQGKFHIFWTTEQNLITFEIHAETLGYVGFGFSAKGAMKGSDIVIGWVNGSHVELQDRYAVDEEEPLIDSSQDYELLFGYENETHTVIRFQRKIDTCDDNDYLLTRDSVYLIYAWHTEDPTSAQHINYHGMQNRGAVLVELFVGQEDNKMNMTEKIFNWDIFNNNVSINLAETSYWCTFHLVDGDDMKQVIGNKPLIQPGHENLVHHMRLLQCTDEATEQIAKFNSNSMDCTNADLKLKLLSFCPYFITGYAAGVDTIVFKQDAGYPLGYGNKSSYVMMETHYNTQEKETPKFVDNSGLEIYVTQTRREFDTGMFFLQTELDGSVIIPPKQKSFTLVSHFPPACTSKFIPEGGIHINSALFHAHFNAYKFRLRHFRNGNELPTIFTVTNYNFNRQINYPVQPERKVLPGDFLTLECSYNTENEDEIIFGGEESFNEMCLVIFSHYPRLTVDKSFSGIPHDKLQQMTRDDQNISSQVDEKLNTIQYFKSYDWNSSKGKDMAIKLQKMQQHDAVDGACFEGQYPLVRFNTAYPEIDSPYVEPPRNC